VKVARTVATGGMEKRAVGTALCSYPLILQAYGERGVYGGLRLHETEEQSGRGRAVEAERERSGRSPPGMRRRHPQGGSGGGLPRLGIGGGAANLAQR
jgi:hypothetical protein